MDAPPPDDKASHRLTRGIQWRMNQALLEQGIEKSRLQAPWRRRLHEVIFESNTWAGRLFDVVLFWVVLASVVLVMLESAMPDAWRPALRIAETAIQLLFTIEFAARLACVGRPLRFLASPFGIIDLLAILPSWLAIFFPGFQALLVLRVLRLLRVFHIFRLDLYLREARILREALVGSARRIAVFLVAVIVIAAVAGAIAFQIEGPANGFTSIPRSVYWAIVTICTVGYGDIAPKTAPGQVLASALMLAGYGILALSVSLIGTSAYLRATVCPRCGLKGHLGDARFCRRCGERLPEAAPPA